MLSSTTLCATGSTGEVDGSDSTERARPAATSTRLGSSRPAAGSSTANRASTSSSSSRGRGRGSRGSYVGPSAEPNYGPAHQCTPPTLVSKVVTAAAHAPLPSSRKPNFIIILTDDQGYDDIGLHQPQKPGSRPTWVQTPNLDKFIQGATEFDNFYVAPMCSQSRAALLTGRDFVRTGTMLINGGYDYINRAETTSAEFFADNGYDTAHFGKWHNGRTLGYEPWNQGFQDSWLPSSHVHLDNLMRHNGKYIQTKGLMEQDLMDKIIQYLGNHEAADAQPFYMYYAPHAIHQGFMRPGQGPRWQRPAPEPYKSKYKNMAPKLPSDTAEVWAMLEYMDDVLGRLFDYVAESPLAENTYIMIMSDNGAELFPTERKGKHKLRRMPSGMMGYKKDVLEGGVRNFLAVKGPGVPAGVTDSTLTDVRDVLPTMADLAGLDSAPHPQWDGISMRNLLALGSGKPAVSLRGTELADTQQTDRFVLSFGPQCWSPDMVPALGPNRQVLKPQPLLDYDTGGVDGRGFARCIGIRYKDYKWIGDTGKVYKFEGTSHIEQPCNEVSGPEKADVASQMSRLARQYFKSLVSDSHSFEKPTFYLGLGDWSVTNVLPDGAHARTPVRVELLPNGLTGFSRVGDSACFALNVTKAGRYRVQIMYTSQIQASFRLSVGPYSRSLTMTQRQSPAGCLLLATCGALS
ncbi:alkaline-phosphatase-like protein [Scenedesmus sp. NREL 46B-D3]|nr:alkaline-phosphatase-like protein [Scenedesmus sp. NREL 46B-D3]